MTRSYCGSITVERPRPADVAKSLGARMVAKCPVTAFTGGALPADTESRILFRGGDKVVDYPLIEELPVAATALAQHQIRQHAQFPGG